MSRTMMWIILGGITFFSVISLFGWFFPILLSWIATIFLIIFPIWLILSINIVGPKEMAVKVYLGIPIGACDSGFRFVPFLPGLHFYLERYPQKMYNLDYPAREVISMAGEYKGEGENETKHYGTQILKVDAMVYLRFPRPSKKNDREKLIEILKSHIPIEDKGLTDWTEESVVGAIRAAIGGMTWKEAIEDIKKVKEETDQIFKRADGALLQAGFLEEDLKIVIKEVRLPSKLEAALPKVDEARIEAEAAPFEAQQRAKETIGSVVQMMAEVRGQSVAEIQKEINGSKELREEFMKRCDDLIRREMSLKRGALTDIRVEGAEGVERTLLHLITAWQKMPQGKSKEKKEDSNKNTEEDELDRKIQERIKKERAEEKEAAEEE